MTESRNIRAYRIFEQALALDAGQRDSHLATACGGDAELLAEVQALLATDAQAQLDTAGLRNIGATTPPELSGRIFGSFRLLERIGDGGMGVVYRGERIDGITQRVAVKIVRQELRGSMSRARFDIERTSLARLEHPGIARLIDAGVTDDNLPWYVMEFVDGLPIDRYCDQHQLGVEQRLDLLLQVCQAVDAAHRALVIHRDIKPGNVLVTAEGQPKLIDFGIAKHLGVVDDPGITRSTGVLFSSYFAAPEQVMGQEVGIATDVFAIGALAYLLLSGQRIHAAAVRSDFDYLSAVTSRDVELASRASGRRALRGDLDRILRKALERDPRHRYASAAELGAEFRRYLKRLPIHARPPSFAYRAEKFARRNAVPLTLGGLLAVALIAGLVSYVAQSRAVSVQRDVAQREAARAQQINGFLTSMLEAADPRLGEQGITLAEALDRAVPRVQGTLGNDPGLAGDVLMTIAGSNGSMGRFSIAAQTAALALAQYARDPARPLSAARALADRGEWLERDGDAKSGEQALREAVARMQALAPRSQEIAEARRQLGTVLTNGGKSEEAMALFDQSVSILRSLPPGMPLARALNDKAVLLGSTGHADQALPLHQESLSVAERVTGADSPFVDDVRSGLAGALGFVGRIEESLAVFRQIADRRARILGEKHQDTLWSRTAVAGALNDLNRFDEALPIAQQAADILTATAGPSHQVTLFARVNLGRAQCGSGRFAAGIASLREVTARRVALYGAEHWLVANSRVVLARCMIRARQLDAAEAILLPAIARLEATQGASFLRTQEAYADAQALYEQRGDALRAATWQAKRVH